MHNFHCTFVFIRSINIFSIFDACDKIHLKRIFTFERIKLDDH